MQRKVGGNDSSSKGQKEAEIPEKNANGWGYPSEQETEKAEMVNVTARNGWGQ